MGAGTIHVTARDAAKRQQDRGWISMVVVDRPVTILTGTVDQAALQGLLRKLYSLGLPLISVNCIEDD